MFRTLLVCCCCDIFIFGYLSAVHAETVEDSVAAADRILALDNVQARKDVDVVFRAADKLVDSGRLEDSTKYFQGGLQIHPANFLHHLKYAEVLEKLKQHEKARIHANIVLKTAEDRELIKSASAIVGRKLGPIEPLARINLKGPILVLIPAGEVDEFLLTGERKLLEKDLGIEVLLRSLTFKMPPAGRDPRATTCSQIRPELEEMRKDDPKGYADLLAKYGYMPNDLADDQKLVKFAMRLAEDEGHEDSARHFRWLVTHGDLAKQWEADGLLAQIATLIKPYERTNIRCIAITPLDIYTENTNYLFGQRVGANALVSYARFTSAFWDEPPKRARLQTRLHAQCLASAGHIFGLPRCEDPNCPRAYPHDLAEQDAKSDELCDVCRKGFTDAFAEYPAK